jgi:hypothetical protein
MDRILNLSLAECLRELLVDCALASPVKNIESESESESESEISWKSRV